MLLWRTLAGLPNHWEKPYIRVFLEDGVIKPEASIKVPLTLIDERETGLDNPIDYGLIFKSGQGQP